MIKAHKAIFEAAKQLGPEGKVVTRKQIIEYVKDKHPEIAEGSILPADCCLNTTTGKHVSKERGFLLSVGPGKYMLKQDSFERESDAIKQFEEIELASASLTLEKDLEDALVERMAQIEDGLKIYEFKDGTGQTVKGRQFQTGVGVIDLLAKDKNDKFVVIELKAGKASYAVIGQILGYISWVRQELADGKSVRGIVIANDFDEKVRYSVDLLEFVKLKKYTVNFTFSEVRHSTK